LTPALKANLHNAKFGCFSLICYFVSLSLLSAGIVPMGFAAAARPAKQTRGNWLWPVHVVFMLVALAAC